MEKKTYQRPKMEIIQLKQRQQLLQASICNANRNGYGTMESLN